MNPGNEFTWDSERKSPSTEEFGGMELQSLGAELAPGIIYSQCELSLSYKPHVL